MTGPQATLMLLLFILLLVEMAVIEVPPGEALLHGLGYDWADACAVINDQPIEPPELIEALRLVVASALFDVIVSAKEQEAYRLQPPSRGSRPARHRRWLGGGGGGAPASYARPSPRAWAAALRHIGRERKVYLSHSHSARTIVRSGLQSCSSSAARTAVTAIEP